jgi:hypothetical protein
MRVINDTKRLIEKMKLYDKVNGGMIPFELWPKQVEWLDCLHKYLLLVMLKKRQVAGTTLTGVDSVCQCGLLQNFLVLALSKTGDDSLEHLDKVWQCYCSLDEDVKLGMSVETKTLDSIKFKNGSRYLSLPANKGAGYSPDRVIIDEAGKINVKNSKITLEQVLSNVYPALEKSEGQLILLGSAEGYGSFQQRYERAKSGLGGWKSFFFSCWDDPTFTKEKRAEMVVNFGEDLTNQEAPRTDSEAFLMSGLCRFNRTSLGEIQNTTIEPGVKGYFERVGTNRIKFTKDQDGWVTLFRDVVKRKNYVAGGDPCQGLEVSKANRKETDEGAFQILSAREREQVCEIRNRHEPEVFAEDCLMAVQYFNNAYTAIERNKERSVILYFLKKEYWNLYYEEAFEDEKQTRRRDVGWFTKADNKRIIIAAGDKSIREKTCIIHSSSLLGQMRTFVRLVDGSCEAQDGEHDDLVMAWLISLQMSNFTEIEDFNDRGEKIVNKFEDTWRNADGSDQESYFSQDEQLERAFQGKLPGNLNYFNR